MRNVLIIDDAIELAEAVALVMSSQGYTVKIAESREDALEIARVSRPDVVLMDLFMPGMGAEDFLRALQDEHPKPEVILFTGGTQAAAKARELGLKYYLQKPFNVDQLLKMIRDITRIMPASASSTSLMC